MLIKRRDKIIRTYMTAINPIVSPRLEDRVLTFTNAAVDQDIAVAPTAYHATWLRFDNATGGTQLLATTSSGTTTFAAPSGLPNEPGAIVAIDLSADAEYPAWKRPVRTYFRHLEGVWKLVGLERLPEGAVTARQVAAAQ